MSVRGGVLSDQPGRARRRGGGQLIRHALVRRWLPEGLTSRAGTAGVEPVGAARRARGGARGRGNLARGRGDLARGRHAGTGRVLTRVLTPLLILGILAAGLLVLVRTVGCSS